MLCYVIGRGLTFMTGYPPIFCTPSSKDYDKKTLDCPSHSRFQKSQCMNPVIDLLSLLNTLPPPIHFVLGSTSPPRRLVRCYCLLLHIHLPKLLQILLFQNARNVSPAAGEQPIRLFPRLPLTEQELVIRCEYQPPYTPTTTPHGIKREREKNTDLRSKY